MSLFEGISEEHERSSIETELRYSLKTKSKWKTLFFWFQMI
jgi:hypothetical protein